MKLVMKKELERIPGNSIVVVQDEDIVKVHVHTLKPGEALNLAQRFGECLESILMEQRIYICTLKK